MYKDKTFLAIIPARGGSKRLPRKNVLDLNGKPLIAWTIEAANKSQYIDKVVVSSEDDEILNISQKYDAMTLKRPSILATDTATTYDTVKHVIDSMEDKYDYILLLQATSPLRNEKHIDEAIELLFQKDAFAILSVCEMDHSPLWSNTLAEDKSMAGFLSDEIPKRSQDLPTYYRLNGAIYICKRDVLLKEETFFIKENIYAYEMKKENSVDIDEKIDFKLAKCLLAE